MCRRLKSAHEVAMKTTLTAIGTVNPPVLFRSDPMTAGPIIPPSAKKAFITGVDGHGANGTRKQTTMHVRVCESLVATVGAGNWKSALFGGELGDKK